MHGVFSRKLFQRGAVNFAQTQQLLHRQMLVGLVLGGRPSRAAGAKGHDVLHRAGIGAAAHHERLAHVAGLFAVCRKQALK